MIILLPPALRQSNSNSITLQPGGAGGSRHLALFWEGVTCYKL